MTTRKCLIYGPLKILFPAFVWLMLQNAWFYHMNAWQTQLRVCICNCRGSEVEGRMSRVEKSRFVGPKVEGRKFRCLGSKY